MNEEKKELSTRENDVLAVSFLKQNGNSVQSPFSRDIFLMNTMILKMLVKKNLMNTMMEKTLLKSPSLKILNQKNLMKKLLKNHLYLTGMV